MVFTALLGGALIGLASAGLLLLSGRIAGVSGIASGMLARAAGDFAWRSSFVAGLVTGGAIAAAFHPGVLAWTVDRSLGALAVAGLLVGVGTHLANGCTSGHGVCGVSRLSPRSIVATFTFVGVGMLCVFLVRRLFGGAV